MSSINLMLDNELNINLLDSLLESTEEYSNDINSRNNNTYRRLWDKYTTKIKNKVKNAFLYVTTKPNGEDTLFDAFIIIAIRTPFLMSITVKIIEAFCSDNLSEYIAQMTFYDIGLAVLKYIKDKRDGKSTVREYFNALKKISDSLDEELAKYR